MRVDVVQLVQVDPVYLESPQADLAVGAEGARPAVDREAVAPAPVAPFVGAIPADPLPYLPDFSESAATV
jgi:hypothetical protein